MRRELLKAVGLRGERQRDSAGRRRERTRSRELERLGRPASCSSGNSSSCGSAVSSASDPRFRRWEAHSSRATTAASVSGSTAASNVKTYSVSLDDEGGHHDVTEESTEVDETGEFERGSESTGSVGKRVRVAVRCRPLFPGTDSVQQEDGAGEPLQPVVHVSNTKKHEVVVVQAMSRQEKIFPFDHAFGPDASQERVYNLLVRPVVHDVLAGSNGAVLAYGQTGTGKTYTMGILSRISPAESSGVIPGAIKQIFDELCSRRTKATCTCSTKVSLSFLQIYLDSLQDLFAPFNGGSVEQSLAMREDPQKGFYVQGLSTIPVQNAAEAVTLINMGLESRQMACTSMNASSSRSHTVLTISLSSHPCKWHPCRETRQREPRAGWTSAAFAAVARQSSSNQEQHTKLRLVDLAGSERVRTGTQQARDPLRVQEAKSINVSLSALGNVVAALAQRDSMHSTGNGGIAGWQTGMPRTASMGSFTGSVDSDSSGASGIHIPFRDSKLTRLLQDTLDGPSGCNTALIATVGPGVANVRETLSTLKFAGRCMHIKAEGRSDSRGRMESSTDTQLRRQLVFMEREFMEREQMLRASYEQEITGLKAKLGRGLPDARSDELFYELYLNFMQLRYDYQKRLEEQTTMLDEVLRQEQFFIGDTLRSTLGEMVHATKSEEDLLCRILPMLPETDAVRVTPQLMRQQVLPPCTTADQLALHAKIASQILQIEVQDTHDLLTRLLAQLVGLCDHGAKQEDDLARCTEILQFLLTSNKQLREEMSHNSGLQGPPRPRKPTVSQLDVFLESSDEQKTD